jgi:hypothetical protein
LVFAELWGGIFQLSADGCDPNGKIGNWTNDQNITL